MIIIICCSRHQLQDRDLKELKDWLDVQFHKIHQKLDAVASSQDKIHQALLRKKSQKVVLWG